MRALHAVEKYPNRRGQAKTDAAVDLLLIFLKRKTIFWTVLRERSVHQANDKQSKRVHRSQHIQIEGFNKLAKHEADAELFPWEI